MTTLKDMQILLVDDDESIRSSMTYYFRKKTHAFLTVETAEEALKLIDSLKWDIIISDYQLPGMNGIAFLDIIGRKHPEIMKILVTAYASLDVATEAIKAGIHDFIQKPFKTETIISSLENLIEKHETRIIAATVNGQQLMEFENVGWEENGDFLIKAIAHQISDSLQTLQGTAELGLLSAEENGEIKSRFSNILDNLSVINHLSDDLKYFGNWLADPIRPVNIVHVLEDRVATCQEKFSSSHIEVFSHFAPDTPKVIQTRKKVFIQIIDNILMNAIQALEETDQKDKIIRIRTEPLNDSVIIVISDNGPGMDDDTRIRARTRGFSTKPNRAGMGLYIADRLCFGIGGNMDIQSEAGCGTVFDIRLAVQPNETFKH